MHQIACSSLSFSGRQGPSSITGPGYEEPHSLHHSPCLALLLARSLLYYQSVWIVPTIPDYTAISCLISYMQQP